MDKRTSATARIVATVVLVAAFVLAIVVISGALGGGDSDRSGGQGDNRPSRSEDKPEREVPATYVVKSGDTLIAIAHRNGVSVARIETLNPEVDPQILIAGEKLKLR